MSDVTAITLFAGAGGWDQGFAACGVSILAALNHNERSLATHALNFPETEQVKTDITQDDPRRFPHATILQASPECRFQSASHGVKLLGQNQPGLWTDREEDDPAIRSRATMYVIHNKGLLLAVEFFLRKELRSALYPDYRWWKGWKWNNMEQIKWEQFPEVANNPLTRAWLVRQAQLSLASNTLKAYGRAMSDFLAFCQRSCICVRDATKADILGYIDDMNQRANPNGDAIRYLHSGVGLANATMQQRLTVVRLFYDYLLEENLRQDLRNPVGKGKYTPGKMFAGRRERALLPHYKRYPWIPGDQEWEAILESVRQEPLRNQLMFLFAYDGALRRSELVALKTQDVVVPYKQLTIREEVAKNGKSRVVMYGQVAQQLLQRYLQQRAEAGIQGGCLFRSESNRNRTKPVTAVSWDKIIERIAQRTGLLHRFTTHTLRHLRLTDLARAGVDLHVINRYAGHQSIETTQLYIHLSGREAAEPVRIRLQDLDRRLEKLLEGEAAHE
jgi:site-specific recombinase XerD